MATNDTLRRFTFDNTHVRGELVGLNKTTKDIFSRQSYPQSVQDLLGELLAAAALLSATVKIEGILTLQIQGNGPIQLLQAETSNKGELRAIARFDEEQELGGCDLLGDKGSLIITIDPDQGRRYQGIVPLEGDNIASCLEGYFKQSEQLDTRIWLASENGVSAGFLLQELPKLGEIQEELEVDEDAWNRLTQLGNTIRNDELLHLESDQILHRLYHEEVVRLYDDESLKFSCSCSKERLSVALTHMGYTECQDIVTEQTKILADCQFCGQHYSFSQSDINGLFPMESAQNGKGLH
jgi:molecular chaperone Hsp33